jgi:hypothetical protein
MANGFDFTGLADLSIPADLSSGITSDFGTPVDSGSTLGGLSSLASGLSTSSELSLASSAIGAFQNISDTGGGMGGSVALAGPVALMQRMPFASRWPNLYAVLAAYAAKGIKVTIPRLWSLLRKFGPQFLVTAGIMSAAALTELLLAHGSKKRRRMNPLNPKALRRATNRLVGFEKRVERVKGALSGVCHKRAPRRRSYCFKCKHNPCTC